MYGKYWKQAGVASILMLLAAAAFATNADWADKMRKLFGAFASLAPYIYSTTAFENPLNKTAITEEIANFQKLAHTVHMKANDPKQSGDPSLYMISGQLNQDVSEALEAFRADNREYARYKLKRVSRNCFQCHSRTDQGPEFSAFNLKINEANLKPLELAEVYVATRQFDRALETMLQVVENKNAAMGDRFEYQKIVKSYLALAVRVKEDPKLALGLVDKVLANPHVAEYLKDDVAAWRKSIDAWMQEPKRSRKGGFDRALQLIAKARTAQEYPLDGRADVLYLRATAMLHGFLETAKASKEKKSEAMYHLGRCYEVLGDVGQWTLQDTYFEACVRNAPQTKIAQRCFNRYQFSMIVGYSGTGGIFLPESERQKIEELRKLAYGEEK